MNRCGMTLLELVVGLTLTGLAAAAGYGAFTSIVDQRTRAETQVDAVSRTAAARQQLANWLAGARLMVEESGPPFRGLDGVDDETPDDELTFLTTASMPGGASEVVVRLHIDRDTTTAEQGLTAELSTWRSTEVERVEIAPHAAGLDFRYLTRMLGRTEWLPSWISSTVLPVGIELTLVPAPGDTLPPLLRLPVVVPVGSGQ